jgi:hypothetical protein
MVPMMKRAFPKIAVAALLGLGAGAIAAVVSPALGQGLPDGNGRDLVRRICVSCHDLSPITGAGGMSRREWEMVVQNMIDMGADITADEVPIIVGYLAASFPAKGK